MTQTVFGAGRKKHLADGTDRKFDIYCGFSHRIPWSPLTNGSDSKIGYCMTIRKVYARCSQTRNPPGLVPPNSTKPGPFSGTEPILRMPQPQKNKNSLRTGKNCHRLHATGMSFMYVCCKQINQLYPIWTTTTNTCIICNKSYDENHEHGPNKVSSGRAFRKTVSSSMQALRAGDGMPFIILRLQRCHA